MRQIERIPVTVLKADPNQPRKKFDKAAKRGFVGGVTHEVGRELIDHSLDTAPEVAQPLIEGGSQAFEEVFNGLFFSCPLSTPSNEHDDQRGLVYSRRQRDSFSVIPVSFRRLQ